MASGTPLAGGDGAIRFPSAAAAGRGALPAPTRRVPPGGSGSGGGGGGLSSDTAVQATNDDAASCKLSCVSLGYYKDDFLKFFVRAKGDRRQPLMNRGYYSRVYAVERLVRRFLSEGDATQRRQIVSLGAGYDTLFFRLHAAAALPSGCVYYETDFADVVRNKLAVIQRHPALWQCIGGGGGGGDGGDADAEARLPRVAVETGEIVAANYCLLASDLRKPEQLQQALLAAGLSLTAPTLFLSECVLIYVESQYSDALVRWAGEAFATSAFVIYEQIRPDDSFGNVMVSSLQSRGCPLLGIHTYPSIEAHQQRYLRLGWQDVAVRDMNDVYRNWIERTELRRIERLEIFDEMEEFHLIQSHYIVAVALQDRGGGGGGGSGGDLASAGASSAEAATTTTTASPDATATHGSEAAPELALLRLAPSSSWRLSQCLGFAPPA